MLATLTYFFGRDFLIQLIAWLGFFAPLPLLLLLIFALLIAFTRDPLPTGEWFPDRREKIAFAWAIFLIPLTSLMVVNTYSEYVPLGLLTPTLCVFLTAIAGRRPFLYSLIIASLCFATYTMGRVFFYSTLYSHPLLTTLRNGFLIPTAILALGGALLAGLCLFLLWRCMDRKPAVWQAQPLD